MIDPTDVPREARHIRDALGAEFDALIDMGDVAVSDPQLDSRRLSRALAAKALRIAGGLSTEQAAAAVIDGEGDCGIDALGIERSDVWPTLWLAQAKWSVLLRGGIGTEVVRKIVEGLDFLRERRIDRFRAGARTLALQAADALEEAECRVVLVFAVMGSGELSTEVRDLLGDAVEKYRKAGYTLTYVVLSVTEIYQAVREDAAPEPITLAVELGRSWSRIDYPYPAYQGVISATQVAGWYERHRERLYDRNMRAYLGLTPVNTSIAATAAGQPKNLVYFNHGIVVLHRGSHLRFHDQKELGAPALLEIHHAGVVDGAQTIASLHHASILAPESVAKAVVRFCIIDVQEAPPEFIRELILNSNTHNPVDLQDHAALDPVQFAIREDLRLSLGVEYAVRRGQPAPSPTAGCSAAEAATALACAHADPDFAWRARHRPALLWQQGPAGMYDALFGHQPTAEYVWNTVGLFRVVREELDAWRRGSGPGRPLAEHGEHLIAHLVYHHLDDGTVDDPESDWLAAIRVQVPNVVRQVLALLVRELGGPGEVGGQAGRALRNEVRHRALALAVTRNTHDVGRLLAALEQLPEPTNAQRGKGRTTVVGQIVEARRIPEGTQLTLTAHRSGEQEALAAWLEEDPRRSAARWRDNPRKPLIWEVDGLPYSLTGLVRHIWDVAAWSAQPTSANGPAAWLLPGYGTLAALGRELS